MAHILVYPFPTSGHIIPLLDLTHRLLRHNLTITIVITANNFHLLHPLLSSNPTKVHHLTLPAPDPTTFDPSKNRLISIMRFIHHHHYPLLLDFFKSHNKKSTTTTQLDTVSTRKNSPPVLIISDFFLGWTQTLAAQIGVPRVVFSPSGAMSFSVLTSFWRQMPQNNDTHTVSFPDVPNSPSFPWWHISQHYRDFSKEDPDREFYRNSLLLNSASWGIVFNTFTELESVYLEHMKKQLGQDRVWSVGPVLPPEDDLVGPINRGGTSSVPCHQVLTWLDSRQDNSVVYVCFGSWTVLTRKQVDELAAGLEKSGVQFIWCFRQPNDRQVAGDTGVLPEGYEDRVAGRGFIINGWAPQVAILRHRAVGTFVTHCGWNSVLEGVAAGVVMLTWPNVADQFINAQLLVDQLGIGIRVGEATHKIPESDELARVLIESLQETRLERVKAKNFQDAAFKAVNGGSSVRSLDEFVKRVNEI